MLTARRARRLGVLAALAMLAAGCQYGYMAQRYADGISGVPWICNPTAPNSVTGPGMGTVNWYAGTSRNPLSGDDCIELGNAADQALAYAQQYPTLGDAEDAGFRANFAFLPGMGTHHGRGAISPADLANPSFNRLDPLPAPGSIIDGVFDPATPEFLQYNGNGRSAELVGMSYYVYTDNGLPPEGFPGNNDWWHHHPRLCFNRTTATAFLVNASDSACAAQNGVNVYLHNYYMLHIWLSPDLKYKNDIHAPQHPCILSGGAIFDLNHPCHGPPYQQPPPAGGGLTAARAATVPEQQPLFCPLGLLSGEQVT